VVGSESSLATDLSAKVRRVLREGPIIRPNVLVHCANNTFRTGQCVGSQKKWSRHGYFLPWELENLKMFLMSKWSIPADKANYFPLLSYAKHKQNWEVWFLPVRCVFFPVRFFVPSAPYG